MIWNDRIKEYKFSSGKRNNYKSKNNDYYNYVPKKMGKQIIKGCEHLKHQELREIQRYGTAIINEKEITTAICNNKAVTIREDEETITAVVRHSSRYYIAVMNKKYKFIKTYLPDTFDKFLDYVQQLIEKEKLTEVTLAA